MTEVTVRPGLPSDAPLVAEFGARTFAETFGAANDPADMALYLRTAYGLAQQAAALADPATAVLIAECGGAIAGYAQLHEGQAPAWAGALPAIELQRFYVDAPWQGRGIARVLMEAVLREAARRGGRAVWLGVWERNERAIAFYRKCGFVDVGSQPFVLGTDCQTDRLMTLALP